VVRTCDYKDNVTTYIGGEFGKTIQYSGYIMEILIYVGGTPGSPLPPPGPSGRNCP